MPTLPSTSRPSRRRPGHSPSFGDISAGAIRTRCYRETLHSPAAVRLSRLTLIAVQPFSSTSSSPTPLNTSVTQVALLNTLRSSIADAATARRERMQAQVQAQRDSSNEDLPEWWCDLTRSTGNVQPLVLEWR